jgi:hypothetical protein
MPSGQGGAARRTNVMRNVGAQERGASACHILDGSILGKVTGPRSFPDGSPDSAPGLAKRQ